MTSDFLFLGFSLFGSSRSRKANEKFPFHFGHNPEVRQKYIMCDKNADFGMELRKINF